MVTYATPTRTQELAVYNNMKNRCASRNDYSNCVIGKTWEKDHDKLYTWFRNNYYILPDGEPVEVDKDILVPYNRIYSEDTCLLVPQSVNRFFSGIHGKNNTLPVGVTFDKKKQKYKASVSHKALGTFNTPDEAHQAYRKAKLKQLELLIEEYKDVVPSEVTEAMSQWLNII